MLREGFREEALRGELKRRRGALEGEAETWEG